MIKYLRLEEETRVVPDHFVYKASFLIKSDRESHMIVLVLVNVF